MATTTSTNTSYVREAPQIEAIKLGLLNSAKALSNQRKIIPPQLVAQMSGLQIKAAELAEAGIGGYQPYLQEAGYTLGDAATTLGNTMSDAEGFQNQALGLMTDAAGNIPGQLSTAQAGMQSALDYGAGATQTASGALDSAAQRARANALAGQSASEAASGQIPGVLSGATAGNQAALSQAQQAVNTAG